jgi:hypothetical protein
MYLGKEAQVGVILDYNRTLRCICFDIQYVIQYCTLFGLGSGSSVKSNGEDKKLMFAGRAEPK